VLVVSAHWESAPLSLSAARPDELVYDFGGFDPLYHTFRYDTPDAGDLPRQVAALLPDTHPVHQHTRRGLDHGAWVPLKIMYPAADVPVLQLSLPTDDPDQLLALGGRLRPLREQGVLVVGSGHMTHGLPFLTREMFTGDVVPGWSADFDAWAAEALARGDVAELARFATAAPGMPYAHPTVEHFTPLFVALGAATDPTAPVRTTIDGYSLGLSRRSFQAA
jgi:4,5-DOPA dioxygenase extradiol